MIFYVDLFTLSDHQNFCTPEDKEQSIHLQERDGVLPKVKCYVNCCQHKANSKCCFFGTFWNLFHP